jgi:hypothetical protein
MTRAIFGVGRGKERLYDENGFTRYSEENPTGRLIVTEDGSSEGLDSQAIALLAHRVFGSRISAL